eukprot:4372462-Pleurochrysis_carterae.AAC.1
MSKIGRESTARLVKVVRENSSEVSVSHGSCFTAASLKLLLQSLVPSVSRDDTFWCGCDIASRCGTGSGSDSGAGWGDRGDVVTVISVC